MNTLSNSSLFMLPSLYCFIVICMSYINVIQVFIFLGTQMSLLFLILVVTEISETNASWLTRYDPLSMSMMKCMSCICYLLQSENDGVVCLIAPRWMSSHRRSSSAVVGVRPKSPIRSGARSPVPRSAPDLSRQTVNTNMHPIIMDSMHYIQFTFIHFACSSGSSYRKALFQFHRVRAIQNDRIQTRRRYHRVSARKKGRIRRPRCPERRGHHCRRGGICKIRGTAGNHRSRSQDLLLGDREFIPEPKMETFQRMEAETFHIDAIMAMEAESQSLILSPAFSSFPSQIFTF